MKKTIPNPLENIAEEQVVLGKLLQGEAAFWRVADVLQPMHFAKQIHQRIFEAIRDLLLGGKRLSLTLIQARVGDEYSEGDDDGLSTMTLLTALLRDAESGDLEGVEIIIDLWKRRTHIAELRRAMTATEDPGSHIADLISQHLERVEDINISGQTTPMRTIGEAAAIVMDFSAKANATGKMAGYDTGLPSVDEILGRVHAGDLGVIAARRGDGKTVIATQLAQHMQIYGPTALFELEMSDLQIAARALAGQTSHSVGTIESGAFDQFALEDLRGAMEALKRSKFYIDDRGRLTVEQIWERCQTMKRTKGLVAAFIDHFRLIRCSKPIRDKGDRMEYISGELKAMAKDLGIAVVALSQVTRGSQTRDESPAPRLSDLEGWGALEQDADWVLSGFRRDLWLKERMPADTESKEFRLWTEKMGRHKGRIEIAALKGRRVNPGEMREFIFDGRAGLIKEIEKS